MVVRIGIAPYLINSGALDQIIQQTINMKTTVAAPQPSTDLLTTGILLQGQQGILERVAQGKPLKGTLEAIACLAETCIPKARVSILYYDPYDDRLSHGGFGQLPESFQQSLEGLVPGPQAGSCGTCLHLKEPVICEDVASDPLWDGQRELCRQHQIQSTWSTPLISPQDLSQLGVFGLYYQDRHFPAEEEQGLVDHFIHLATIATERHRRDDERSRQAWQDGLTGLGNRHQLQARSADILTKYQAEGRTICLAFIDLDNFRLFNHNYGHHLGDKLLQHLSKKLKDRLAPYELLARFGGDEFIALIEGNPQAILERLDQLAAELDGEAMFIEHARARLTLSIGLVNCADVGFDLNQSIMQADAATRRAKEGGRNRTVLVDANQLDEVQARMVVAQKLEDVVRQSHINPHGQPIVDLHSGMPIGTELLFRPKRGMLAGVSPQHCINIAETTGLIDSLGLQMLYAAYQISHHPQLSTTEMVVNVNLSVHQLMRQQFFDEVMQGLELFAVKPERICLEVTESRWLETEGPSRDVLDRLVERGFKLALDDFGTGYASLVVLRAFPFHHVKVDKSFVDNIEFSEEARSLCRAMLEMGHACGVEITAEGIETEEQRLILSNMGFRRGQGYLFAPPVPMEDLPEVLAELASKATPA